MDIVKNQDSPSKHWIGWLCFTSHRQRGHLETAPPFGVPCEEREDRFLHRPHRESNSGSLHDSPLHNRCATPAPLPNIGGYSSVPDVIASTVCTHCTTVTFKKDRIHAGREVGRASASAVTIFFRFSVVPPDIGSTTSKIHPDL